MGRKRKKEDLKFIKGKRGIGKIGKRKVGNGRRKLKWRI